MEDCTYFREKEIGLYSKLSTQFGRGVGWAVGEDAMLARTLSRNLLGGEAYLAHTRKKEINTPGRVDIGEESYELSI